MIVIRNLWINVYRVERAYGGPEEGGWWYDQKTFRVGEEVQCECDLPVLEWQISDEMGNEGWHCELNTHVDEHLDSCDVTSKHSSISDIWLGETDEWYSQDPKYYDQIHNDEPMRGETFSSGEIEISVELFDEKGYSQERPYYC